MKPKVYIETTIVSYLTARRSPQLIMAANQESTRIWWDDERGNFELFVSEAVLLEAAAGDAAAAQRRLDVLREITELRITDEARQLAKELVEKTPLSSNSQVDGLHIATATVNGMDYLLTWNCRHIANATLRNTMAAICESAGYEIPVICTPLELLRSIEMIDDPIVAEVRKARDEYAKRFNYNLDAICRDLQQKELQSGRKLVSFPPKRPKPAIAARPPEWVQQPVEPHREQAKGST